MAGAGILAIWNDCTPGLEVDLDRWYQAEHLPERLAVPGFQFGRRLRAIEGAPRYFTYYDVESPDVLSSPAYRHRLDHPTAETRRMMQFAFRNMSRTICRRETLHEGHRCDYAVTLRMASPAAVPQLRQAAAHVETAAHQELWIAINESCDPSVEESLRGPDAAIGACLLLEFNKREEARTAAERIEAAFADGVVGLYELIAALAAADQHPTPVSTDVEP